MTLYTAETALELLNRGQFADFQQYLDNVPASQRPITVTQLVNHAYKHYDKWDACVMLRALTKHEKFRRLVPSEVITVWEQALVFINTPFLRTRVSMSFFDHPKMKRKAVDYDFAVYSREGNLITSGVDTIHAQQTHNFDLAEITQGAAANEFGLFVLRTAERDLGSLRIYAYWSNAHGMTSTHEKGAIVNPNKVLVYPTIVCGPEHETFLAIGNNCTDALNLTCTIMNAKKEMHPNKLELTFPARSAALLPLSQSFPQLREFLGTLPGAAYIGCSHNRGLYYYFVHNTKQQTWQIQHL